MDFRILGPLEVATDRSVRLGSPRQRTLLALLLIRPDEAVSTDRLVEELWGEDPPQTARHTLQTHVHQLRKGLGPDAGRLEARPSGYRMRVLPDELDALIFQDLTERGRRALTVGEPRAAASLLREALGLWRGSPLADLPDVTALEPERARLNGMRLAALEDRIEADLALGRHAGLVEELAVLATEHPYRERLWGQLMVALYRSGRQAEALAAYRRVREMLGEELGLDPGPDLARLQEQILIQDPALQGPEPRPAVEAPHNLPMQRTSFVGRRHARPRAGRAPGPAPGQAVGHRHRAPWGGEDPPGPGGRCPFPGGLSPRGLRRLPGRDRGPRPGSVHDRRRPGGCVGQPVGGGGAPRPPPPPKPAVGPSCARG